MRPDEVPSGPLLLDTDVYSFLSQAKGPHEAYRELVAGHDQLLLSFITVGEVLYGARARKWGEEKIAALETSLRKYGVVEGNHGVARAFSLVKARFADQTQYDDLWIAACALGQSPALPLVTNDKWFLRVADEFGLVVVRADDEAG